MHVYISCIHLNIIEFVAVADLVCFVPELLALLYVCYATWFQSVTGSESYLFPPVYIATLFTKREKFCHDHYTKYM